MTVRENGVYLDCNATTPVDPEIAALVAHHMIEEFGNAGSRTHATGSLAKQAVGTARRQVASVVGAQPDEVIFTSGATEANNIALLGLVAHGLETGRTHVVSTAIEHKAVLEPLQRMEEIGFTVDLVEPDSGGRVSAREIADRVTDETLLVSVMSINNETGVMQPIDDIADLIASTEAYLHTDAAQGFGKVLKPLQNPRIDLISISGHKIYAPKGIGSLILRRRGYQRPPLQPLMYGGGQERGLRPGTLPVGLIAGLGLASQLAQLHHNERREHNLAIQEVILDALSPLGVRLNGDPAHLAANTVNVSIPGLDAEAAMVALKGIAEVSSGSACTSSSYEPSHVLTSMGLPREQIDQALRISWFHGTEIDDLQGLVKVLGSLAGSAGSRS